jgi:hypothetical protein
MKWWQWLASISFFVASWIFSAHLAKQQELRLAQSAVEGSALEATQGNYATPSEQFEVVDAPNHERLALPSFSNTPPLEDILALPVRPARLKQSPAPKAQPIAIDPLKEARLQKLLKRSRGNRPAGEYIS